MPVLLPRILESICSRIVTLWQPSRISIIIWQPQDEIFVKDRAPFMPLPISLTKKGSRVEYSLLQMAGLPLFYLLIQICWYTFKPTPTSYCWIVLIRQISIVCHSLTLLELMPASDPSALHLHFSVVRQRMTIAGH